MPKRFPVLTLAEVREIVQSLGFTLRSVAGSHEQWEHAGIAGKPRLVTVDCSYSEFEVNRIKTMIAQSGLPRDEFYGACRSAAKKINLRR